MSFSEGIDRRRRGGTTGNESLALACWCLAPAETGEPVRPLHFVLGHGQAIDHKTWRSMRGARIGLLSVSSALHSCRIGTKKRNSQVLSSGPGREKDGGCSCLCIRASLLLLLL